MNVPCRTPHRVAAVAALTATLVVVGAGPAFAHVTAQPGTAEKGGYAVVDLRVPNESDTSGTVRLTVTLPTDHPISSVLTTPVAGWSAATSTVPLKPPVQDDGRTITETVGSVTWTANPGTRIEPGQYLDFPLSLGPMPDDADQIVLAATQTYDNGDVVNWNEPMRPNGAEPEHPAPVVQLTAAAGESGAGGAQDAAPPAATAPPAGPAAAAPDDTARWLGGLGLLVGALGLGFGAGALVRSRRAAGPPAAPVSGRRGADTPSREGADASS
jgi:periplasmic copper chaperone A